MGRPGQTGVSPIPGPSDVRVKSKGPFVSVSPLNVMNPVRPAGKSLIMPVPAKPGKTSSRAPLTLLTRFVATETWRHANPTELGSGSQTTAAVDTCMPPALQFATDKWPIIEAEADGANVAQASTAKLKTPDFSTFRFFNFDLRKYRATI